MTEEERQAVCAEREMMRCIDHPSIMKYSDYYEDDKRMIFVMDYMVSDMRDLLLGIDMPFDEQASKEIFY